MPQEDRQSAATASGPVDVPEILPLAEDRFATAVDLVCERLPRQPRASAAFVFEHPDSFHYVRHLEARDADGRMLGVAATGRPRWMNPDRSFLRVVVRREAEGRGLGRALRREALALVDADTAELIGAVDDEEPRALAIARHWAFGIDEHAMESVLDLAGCTAPQLPEGVTVEDASDLVFADRDAVDAMLLRSQTNPEARQGWLFDLDRLAGMVTDTAPAVCSVARVDGAPAAIVFGDLDEGVFGIAYSGVDPAHRGRGLMVLTKQHAHVTARGRGAREARTSNEEHNRGIRRINAALGYRVVSGTYRLRQPFVRP